MENPENRALWECLPFLIRQQTHLYGYIPDFSMFVKEIYKHYSSQINGLPEEIYQAYHYIVLGHLNLFFQRGGDCVEYIERGGNLAKNWDLIVREVRLAIAQFLSCGKPITIDEVKLFQQGVKDWYHTICGYYKGTIERNCYIISDLKYTVPLPQCMKIPSVVSHSEWFL